MTLSFSTIKKEIQAAKKEAVKEWKKHYLPSDIRFIDANLEYQNNYIRLVLLYDIKDMRLTYTMAI